MTKRRRSVPWMLVALALAAVGLWACSDDSGGGGQVDAAMDAESVDSAVSGDANQHNDSAVTDDAATSDGGTQDGGGDGGQPAFAIDVYVRGDVTAKTFNDGFSGQTPRNFTIGFSRVDLMTSENDATPVTVFDFGSNYVEVDMLSETKIGSADLRDIPSGVYTYGRALLVMARFDVDVTVHTMISPTGIAGTATVTAALSDATIDGHARSQGWAQEVFTIPNLPAITKDTTLPDLPSTAAGTIVEENGKMWLVFPLNPSLPVAPIPNIAHKLTMVYDEFESFRWQDQPTSGYSDGVFDSDQDGNTEPLQNVGATDYHIIVE